MQLNQYIEIIEECLGRKAVKIFRPLQPGDVPDTWADVRELIDDVGYSPRTTVEIGVQRFIAWYRSYYKV